MIASTGWLLLIEFTRKCSRPLQLTDNTLSTFCTAIRKLLMKNKLPHFWMNWSKMTMKLNFSKLVKIFTMSIESSVMVTTIQTEIRVSCKDFSIKEGKLMNGVIPALVAKKTCQKLALFT